MELSKYIRSIPDYPKKGILFRDITTLIKNKEAFKETIDKLCKLVSKKKFDKLIPARKTPLGASSEIAPLTFIPKLQHFPTAKLSTA